MSLEFQIEYQKHKYKMTEEYGWCPDTYQDWLEERYKKSLEEIEHQKSRANKYCEAFSNASYERNIYKKAVESFKEALDTLQSIETEEV